MDISKKSVEVFCCYARKDQPLLLELKAHLVPLQREGLITLWADVDIDAGIEWEKEIHHHLNTARIILLLISPDFMASEYCYSVEMQRALERHERGDARVVPILLRPVHWQRAAFSKLQVLPTNASPITSKNWYHLDEAFYNVVEGIRNTVEALEIKSPDPEVHSPNQRAEEVLRFQKSVHTIEEQESLTVPGASREHLETIGRSRKGRTDQAKREEAIYSEIRSGHGPGSPAASSEITMQKPVSIQKSRWWRGNRLALIAVILAVVLVVVVSVSYLLVTNQPSLRLSSDSTPIVGSSPSSSPRLRITPMTLIGSDGGGTRTCTSYTGSGINWECKVTLQNTSSVGINWSAKGPIDANISFPPSTNGHLNYQASGHLNPNEQYQLFIDVPSLAWVQAPFAITIAVQNGPSYTVTWNYSSSLLKITPMTLIGSEGGDTNTCTGYVPGGVKWECKVTLQNTSSVRINWSAKGPDYTDVAFPAGDNGSLNPNEQHQLFIEFPFHTCAQAPFAITIAVQNGPIYTVTWKCS